MSDLLGRLRETHAVVSETGSGGEDRAAEGLAHLQAAARELIAAARAVLDVAEELVEDPATANSIVGAVTGAVRGAARFVAEPGGRPGGVEDDAPGVKRIRIS